MTSPPVPKPSDPLAGRQILVTRAAEVGCRLSGRLRELGAVVVSHPVIEILPPTDRQPLDQAIGSLEPGDWVVFVSGNGVRSFVQRAVELGRSEVLHRSRIAAIGRGTVAALQGLSLPSGRAVEVDLIPTESNSASLAQALIDTADPSPRNPIVLVRADRGSRELPELLAAAKLPFTELVAYRSVDVTAPQLDIARAMEAGEFAWTTITSSAIASSAIKLFGDSLRQTRLATISPTTTKVVQSLGYTVAAEASNFNLDGVVAAILKSDIAPS